MAVPHKCPVCGGTGTVPNDFYGPPQTTNTSPVVCKSCTGTGIIWDYSTFPIPTYPIPMPAWPPIPPTFPPDPPYIIYCVNK